MTDQELSQLIEMNAKRFETEKNALYQEFLKMDAFIKDGLKKNATHRHFKTRKEMTAAMLADFNPYNTFSFGRKKFEPTREAKDEGVDKR